MAVPGRRSRFATDENNQLQFANQAASCMLPPSVGVRTLRTNHTVDVGQ